MPRANITNIADASATDTKKNSAYGYDGQTATYLKAQDNYNRDGLTAKQAFDPNDLYRLKHKVTNLPGAVVGQDLTYTYDHVGNITNIADASATDTKKNSAYGYDDLYRLTSVTVTNDVRGNNYTQSYAYDPAGNITSKSDVGTYSYAGGTGTNYADPDAVTSAGTTSYSYDRR